MGYLPSHTELQTIPKCKCLMGVGGGVGGGEVGGGIVVLPPRPSGSHPDRWRNPRPDGVAKVWPGGKSVGLCQHSLQCTQRPQDQSEHKRSS